jgi:hypothetical protein
VNVEAFFSVLTVREKFALFCWVIVWAIILFGTAREEFAFSFLLVVISLLRLGLSLMCRL